jgi:Zn-dependent protease with chaperone function
MPFLILLLLTLTCLQGRGPQPPKWLGQTGSVAAIWLTAAALVCAAALLVQHFRRRLYQHSDQRKAILRRYRTVRQLHLLSLLLFHLLALYGLGWGAIVGDVWSVGRSPLPGLELLLLGPFLTALILSWACYYDMECAIYLTTSAEHVEALPARWTYVSLQIRHNLILIFPPLLLLASQQVILCLFPGLETAWLFPLLAVVLLAGVFVGIPWLLRLFLGLKPLPPGPLRERLRAAAGRLNFRCNDFLLWNTHGTVANAMVTGILPQLRYVVFTDRLLSDLTADEVEAVLGHEIGHIKHHHMLFYLGFLVASMVVVAGVWNTVVPWLGLDEVANDGLALHELLGAVPLLTVLGAYIFLVFGFVSRRCERQADIYGCRAVSCSAPACSGHAEGTTFGPLGRGLCATGIGIFIEALEKVARSNGISRDRPGWLSSWQHSTIARRVDFLQQMRADPALEGRFQRRVGLVKWGMLLGLAAVLLLLGPKEVWAILQGL